jgi:tetratricopeptide (TPR) repeat protein
LNNLASVQSSAGKYDEAEATYGRARRVAEATQGDDHPDLAYVHLGLAAMDSKRGRYDDAEAAFRRALEILAAALPPDHPRLAMARADLAGLLLERGRIDEARALVESAWERAIGGQMGALDRGQIAFIRARTLAAGDAPDRSPALEAAQYALEAFEEVSDQENIEQVRAWLADHDG